MFIHSTSKELRARCSFCCVFSCFWYRSPEGYRWWRALRWRHNGCDSVSNHQPYDCLLSRLFRPRWKKTSKLRVTGLCVGNSPGPMNSPHKGPVTRKMFPFDDVIMSASALCERTISWYKTTTWPNIQQPIYYKRHVSTAITIQTPSYRSIIAAGNDVYLGEIRNTNVNNTNDILDTARIRPPLPGR